MASSKTRHPRYDDVVRRLTNAVRVEGDRAHVEEIDSDELRWLWNSNVRSTALVLERHRHARRQPAVRARARARAPAGARERPLAQHAGERDGARVARALLQEVRGRDAEPLGDGRARRRARRHRDVPQSHGGAADGAAGDARPPETGRGRRGSATWSSRAPAPASSSTRRGCSTSRPTPPPPSDQGMRVERRFERFVEGGGSSPAATSFAAGDLIRVTLTVTLPKERRFVAVTDALAGGVEAVDSWFRTTASDLAREASSQPEDRSYGAALASRRVRPRREVRRPRRAVCHAVERRPPRVLVSRARDDRRVVQRRGHVGGRDVRARGQRPVGARP